MSDNNRTMNIAVLIDLLVPGGVQKAAIEEVRNLRTSGHKAELFCLTRTRVDYQYEDLLKGIPVRYLSDRNPLFLQRAVKIPFFTFLTTNHLLSPFLAHRYRILKDFDLLIAHGTTTCPTALAVSRHFNVPYAAFIWDPMGFILHTVYRVTPLQYFSPLLDIIIRLVERRMLTNARLIVAPSSVHKRALQKAYGIQPIVIPPGHDFITKRKPGKRTYILGYSRWQKEKHPDFFLKLAQQVNLPIVLAGLWSNQNDLKALRREIHEKHLNIQIVQPVHHKDIPRLAGRAIVWVHPHFEAFGMPGLELASQGVPIIIPKGSGVTDLFKNGVHGLFPPRNERALIAAVKTMLENPVSARQMGRKAAQVAKAYTWKAHTAKLLDAISGRMKENPPATILHNSFVTTASIGGGDRFMIEIVSRLKPRKFTLITPEIGLYHWKKSKAINVSYKLLSPSIFDNNESPLLLFLAYLIRSIQTIMKLTFLPQVKILISTNELTPETLPAYWYKKTHPQTRWIARIFHLVPPPTKREGNFLVNGGSFLLQRASLMLMRSCDRILVDNPFLKQELMKLGFPKQQTEVHYGGVDVEKIGSYKAGKTEAFSAISGGRFSPPKGTFDLVPIWEKVIRTVPKAKLGIVGDGPEDLKQKLRDQIQNANLKDHVKLLGFLPHGKPLFDMLKNARLLIFPDHEAGFGLIVVEPRGAGLPVVAYNLPIFGETYKKGYLTAPLKQTDTFAANIVKLLEDQALHQTIQTQAREEVGKFDWNRAARKFDRLLNRLSQE